MEMLDKVLSLDHQLILKLAEVEAVWLILLETQDLAL
jgi:hypothetical protein